MPRSLPPKTASLACELALWSEGCRAVYGLDEAGRGAWAGPVVAAAVCLPCGEERLSGALQGVNDSKQLRPAARERLAGVIPGVCAAWGVGEASAVEIDALGILPATQLAMRRALDGAVAGGPAPDHLLLDAMRWNWNNTPITPLIHGDARSLSIAAASILAKVHRDRLMTALDAVHPGYGFAAHKGYGTEAHQRALAQHGPCPAHRRSFAPLRAALW